MTVDLHFDNEIVTKQNYVTKWISITVTNVLYDNGIIIMKLLYDNGINVQ